MKTFMNHDKVDTNKSIGALIKTPKIYSSRALASVAQKKNLTYQRVTLSILTYHLIIYSTSHLFL